MLFVKTVSTLNLNCSCNKPEMS